MNKKTLTIIEVIIHALFWSIPTYFFISHNSFNIDDLLVGEYMHLPFLSNTLFNMVLVYTNIFIIYPAFRKKKLNAIQYWSIMAIFWVVGANVKIGIDYLFSLYYFSNISSQVSFLRMFLSESLFAGLLLSQSILYCFVKEYIRTNIINRKLVEEKLSLELKYLKAQINPHFLFNTLNNLYAIALKNNDNETAMGLTKLSQIMRYMLKDINETEISLDKEIEYLKSYIDLQKLRFSESDDIHIDFDVKGNTFDVNVAPFLFIVFIENAFKYGINYKKHSFINIYFEIVDNGFIFKIKNSIHKVNEEHKQGVGLKNIKERLGLLYPGKHKLEMTNQNDIFSVYLQVDLT